MAAAVEQIQESAPGSGPAVGYPSSYMEDDNGDDDDDNEDFEDHSSESSVSRCSSVESLEGKREVEADDVACTMSLIRNGFSKTTECQRLNCGGGVDRNEL